MKNDFSFLFVFFVFVISSNLQQALAEDIPPLCLEAQQCVETSFPPALSASWPLTQRVLLPLVNSH